MTERELTAIIGPSEWQHAGAYCNCDDAAGQDPEAYMSQECIRNMQEGIARRAARFVAFEEAMNHMAWLAIRKYKESGDENASS